MSALTHTKRLSLIASAGMLLALCACGSSSDPWHAMDYSAYETTVARAPLGTQQKVKMTALSLSGSYSTTLPASGGTAAQ